MNIGIDIDDTLSLLNESMVAYGQKFNFEEFGTVELMDLDGYNAASKFNWTKQQNTAFFAKYILELTMAAPARPLASEVVKNLREEGHKIYIISARGKEIKADAKQTLEISKQWLEKNNIEYDYLILGCTEKGDKCVELGIDIFLDDKISNCEDVANRGITTYIMNCPHNKMIGNDANFTKVYSFFEFYTCVIKEKKYRENNKSVV